MLFKMPKISFFLRSSSCLEQATVFCRVTFNGTKNEFSIKEKVFKNAWCVTTQRLTTATPQKKYLDHLQETILYKLKTFAISNENATAQELINLIQPKKNSTVLLSEICENYVSYLEAKKDSDGNPEFSEGTIKNHTIKINNLLKFEAIQKRKYYPEDFTMKLAYVFIEWFQATNQTTKVTTANRNVLFYKKALKWHRKTGNKSESDLFHFEGEKDRIKPPVFLTISELKQIEETTFVSTMLNQIKDLFIFQCYTGLSYCDIWGNWQLKREDYGTILTGTRGKNSQMFFLPVEYEQVSEIINKYNGQLPEYCNATYNRLLKEISALCNITKRITTHTGRKTFATLMDANGWTRETIAKMLGHKSIRTTELYYLGESFARLENEFKQRKTAV